MNAPKDFSELVQWACWEVIKGITSGEPINKTMYHVLGYVRLWKPEDKKGQP